MKHNFFIRKIFFLDIKKVLIKYFYIDDSDILYIILIHVIYLICYTSTPIYIYVGVCIYASQAYMLYRDREKVFSMHVMNEKNSFYGKQNSLNYNICMHFIYILIISINVNIL